MRNYVALYQEVIIRVLKIIKKDSKNSECTSSQFQIRSS